MGTSPSERGPINAAALPLMVSLGLAHVFLAHVVQFLDEDVFGNDGASATIDVIANFLRQLCQIRFLDMLEVDLLVGIKGFEYFVAQEKLRRLWEGLEEIGFCGDRNFRQNITLKS